MRASCQFWNLTLLLVVSSMIAGCGGGSGSDSVFDDRSTVNSPDGYVPFGDRAHAPDDSRYACEIEPEDQGSIGIFDQQDQLIITIHALPPGDTNTLKALSWSRDSSCIAVMYHGGVRSGITLYDAQTGDLLRSIGDDAGTCGYYHYMVFSEDNAWVYVSCDGKNIQDQLATGLAWTADYFVQYSGANLPWVHYGWDIGRHPWGGAHDGFSVNAQLQSDFAELAQHGVKLVRVFTFCDLRSGILFDPQGLPTGFDQYALQDFQALVSAAEDNGLKLIPVLFDFTLADGVDIEGSNQVGEHPDLFTDSVKRAALVEIFRPLIQQYGNHQCIAAWDIINEPEYASAVSFIEVRTFVAAFLNMIEAEAPEARKTVGCRNRGDLTNWQGTGLDIYQFHYYDNMESQFPLDYPISQLSLDRPVLIGEAQPSNLAFKMDTALANGCMGILFWSLNSDYDFRASAGDYSAWVTSH